MSSLPTQNLLVFLLWQEGIKFMECQAFSVKPVSLLQRLDHPNDVQTLCHQLTQQSYRDLLVIHELYRQQLHMYNERSHQMEDRIVSIHQPHVRPIVRGKAKACVEFGAKIAVSMRKGYAFLDRLSWDNFNESATLI